MTLFGLNLNFRHIKKFIRIPRQEFLLWGTVAVFVLLLTLIAWDGYLFYSTVFKERARGAGVTSREVINAEEIDEVIKLLDEREERFEEILGVKTATSSSRVP